jgi:hypothetical protein
MIEQSIGFINSTEPKVAGKRMKTRVTRNRMTAINRMTARNRKITKRKKNKRKTKKYYKY